MKVDVIAFGAHPDDVELSCVGTLMQLATEAKSFGIVDLTRGELGTRGTPEIRTAEANESAKLIGASFRDNLDLEDGFISNSKDEKNAIIRSIRTYRPETILINAVADRHPDHGNAGKLLSEAAFLSGLEKIETIGEDGSAQNAWRPKRVYHYIQFRYMSPSFVVDISPFFDKKMEAIKAFRSQFYNPASSEAETLISQKGFLDVVEARAREMGAIIGVKYGEGFVVNSAPGVRSLSNLI